ncbi:MAG: M20 family metallopeptidase [Dehalococcoidia bacterium]|nr:M20 family metallopeptidase [Dehalococcoidia bacterium]
MNEENVSFLKDRAVTEITRHRSELLELAQRIHDHPETAMQEHRAAAWCADALTASGFSVEIGIADMPTAFKATSGQGSPVIAFIAEYDALPGLGHACGHNLIATAAIAAAIGAKAALGNLDGTVMAIGTPAEELTGGKIAMLKRGVFQGIDAALMLHPAAHDSATIKALACLSLEVEFYGKEAHAAAHPELGINALEAMVLSFNAINALRQHIRSDARLHGIITDGGQAANIVPAHSAGRFLVRASDTAYVEDLKERVLCCFQGAAIATGARLEYHWNEAEYYAPMRNNKALAQLYVTNLAKLGREIPYYDADQSFGSTDTGNLSQVVPTIHASVAIAPPGVSEHTLEFARLARGEESFDLAIQAATALAMVAVDLLTDPSRMALVKHEFAEG